MPHDLTTTDPDPFGTLASALAAYGRALAAILAEVRRAEADAARAYFGLVPGGTGCVWEWVAVLSGWPRWRVAELARRLALPDPAVVASSASACRAAADAGRWTTFVSAGRGLREVLLTAADLLESVHRPDPLVASLIDRLNPLGRAVEGALAALPASNPAVRLADLISRSRGAGVPLPPGPCARSGAPTDSSREYTKWLRDDGTDWFHDLADLARTCREAREWLVALNTPCFPAVHESGEVAWPETVPVLQPGTRWLPGGVVGAISAVERFATEPGGAKFTVCLGDPAAPLATAVAAWQHAERADLSPAIAALAGAVERARTGALPAAEQVLSVLDELSKVEPFERGEALLPEVCAWSASGGWEILSDPCAAAERKAVFKRDVPAGTVLRFKAYGLTGHAGIVRPAEVVVSAGSPPYGLTELEAAAVEAPGANGAELRDALRGLRLAGADGYLEPAAVDLYVLFWDRVRPEWDVSSAEDAGEFADGLAALLRETFGLATYYPTDYRERPPEWVLVPPGARLTTGRVTRVVRPGLLREPGGDLRLPARVEAE